MKLNATGLILTMLASPMALAQSDPSQLPTDRAVMFLTKIHTGERMDAKEWLLLPDRSGERFEAFGGLDAVVRQTTALAHRYGGVRSIAIRTVKKVQNGFVITADVLFLDEKRRQASPAMAEREKQWTLRVESQDGAWKLAF